MKRFLITVFAIFLLVACLPFSSLAAQYPKEDVVFFEDGSYMVTTVEECPSQARTTKNHNKTQKYYDANNVLQWRIVLVATFTYDGTTSTCIAAGCNADVYTDDWTVISESSSRSGNTAYGYATLRNTVLGVTVNNPSYTLTLTCDKDGNVS